MPSGCQIVPSPDHFASDIIAYFDCQAQTIGSQGYAALAVPGSSAYILISTFITLLIAFTGYRLILGDIPSFKEGVLTVVKIGIVLAFATSWPAYRTVMYDVALYAPARLVQEIGASSQLPGANGGLPARLDAADHAFQSLAVVGVGSSLLDANGRTSPMRLEPAPWVGFDAFAIGISRMTFISTAVGAFALVRIAAGLLLALGPLFLAFLLFRETQELAYNWMRALGATALAAVATAILLGVELGLLEPWLASLLEQRANGYAIVGVPSALLAVTVIFTVVLVALLYMIPRLTFGSTFQFTGGGSHTSGAPIVSRDATLVSERSIIGSGIRPDVRSRAAVVADAVSFANKREEQPARVSGPSFQNGRARFASHHQDMPTSRGMTGSARHRGGPSRISSSSRRRDQ